MAARNDDMGPLPEGDRQDTIQHLSLQALRNLLPVDLFLFRRESEDDKGIDGTLEAKLKGRFTNCRANAQVKSTDKPRRNGDGSVSYSIETSNLNYLLNGASPLYFLWVAPDKEMRYAWAWEEWRRLDAETPGWRSQGTFTIRFREVLDGAAVVAIQERVINEARLGRDIRETLARETLEERVLVSIDPKTLASEDPQQIFEWITSSGMTIASSGYGKQIIQWLDVLAPAQRNNPHVQLVAAFALAGLGKCQAAFGPLAEAASGRASLSRSDKRILDYLQDVCLYQTGAMDQAEYLRREGAKADSRTGVPAAEHRLEVLRLERLDTLESDQRSRLLLMIRETCGLIQSAADAAPAQKIHARLHLMLAEADDLTGRFTSGAMQVRVRQDMGFRVHPEEWRAGLNVAEEWRRWDRDAIGLVQAAEAERHPLLVAEAIMTRLTGHHAFWASCRNLAAANDEAWQPDASTFAHLIGEVERAAEIFRRAGSVEGETRAKLLLADFRYLLGDRASANALAENALVIAQAWHFWRLESHAREYTDGLTNHEQFLATIATRRSQDEDIHSAGETDERLRLLARRSLEAMHLPMDRLPVVEREWQSLRLIARERVGWCRHINLMQDKSHTLRPETLYLRDPERFCICEKLGHEANIRHPEPEVGIESFKRAYCERCADRSPKVEAR